MRELIDISKDDLVNAYGVWEDGRIFKCVGSDLDWCEHCVFEKKFGSCENLMKKWLDEEIDKDVDEPEIKQSHGEKVVLDTINTAAEFGLADEKVNIGIMGIIAAALVDIKNSLINID